MSKAGRKRNALKAKPRKAKKITLADQYVRKDVVTPEYAAKFGHTFEKVGDHVATGRAETTIRVRASPLERLYHAGKSITDIQYAAGLQLYKLFRETGLDPARATDWTKPFVDGGSHGATAEWNERARNEYARVVRYMGGPTVNPMLFPMLKAVVIEERDLGMCTPTPYAPGSQDSKAFNLAILLMGLDELAAAFGLQRAMKR